MCCGALPSARSRISRVAIAVRSKDCFQIGIAPGDPGDEIGHRHRLAGLRVRHDSELRPLACFEVLIELLQVPSNMLWPPRRNDQKYLRGLSQSPFS
jgi:hypothetical protein